MRISPSCDTGKDKKMSKDGTDLIMKNAEFLKRNFRIDDRTIEFLQKNYERNIDIRSFISAIEEQENKMLNEWKHDAKNWINYWKECSKRSCKLIDANSNKMFYDCCDIILHNINCLYLGSFYSYLTVNEELWHKVKNMKIGVGGGKLLLRGEITEYILKEIYNRCQSAVQSGDDLNDCYYFFTLIYKHTVRSITIALNETLKNEEIEKLFVEHIFLNKRNDYDNFLEVLKFIRNVFSHELFSKMELMEKAYKEQMGRLGKNGISVINFYCDYANIPIDISSKHDKIKIKIDFNNIKTGSLYTDIIDDKQTLLFMEACNNWMSYLRMIMKI